MITLGIETLTANKTLSHRRVGLLAHPASVDRHLNHTLTLLQNCNASVRILFGPEHGFNGYAQYMEPITDRAHSSGIPLVSLYGDTEESLSPSLDDLSQIDVLVVDLMDVGSRYYTFVWTALLALRMCHRAGVEMVLTDRPNPIGGTHVEGAPQSLEFLSFVGLKPISNRHGLTPGELLTMAAKDEGLEDALTVVPMLGWKREMMFEDTGHPFVFPSPNMPTVNTALVYPGLCLLEGTDISEGRGTAKPFELCGAPGLDGKQLAKRLNNYELPGVGFRPVTFKPGFQKYAGAQVGGVEIHVFDKKLFRPYKTGVAMLLALKQEIGDRFKWRDTPYEFVTDKPAIDLLCGSPIIREIVDSGGTLADAEQTWLEGEQAFVQARQNFSIY